MPQRNNENFPQHKVHTKKETKKDKKIE